MMLGDKNMWQTKEDNLLKKQCLGVNDSKRVTKSACISPLIARKTLVLETALRQRSQSIQPTGKSIRNNIVCQIKKTGCTRKPCS